LDRRNGFAIQGNRALDLTALQVLICLVRFGFRDVLADAFSFFRLEGLQLGVSLLSFPRALRTAAN